jgi:hypothetical protein
VNDEGFEVVEVPYVGDGRAFRWYCKDCPAYRLVKGTENQARTSARDHRKGKHDG